MRRLALAIARDRTDLADLPGVARFASRGLAIFHLPAPADAASPSLETIEAYASGVASLHARETILPLRFGSLLETEDELDDWLRVRSDEWRAGLDDVEGCEEMGVRVLLDLPQIRRFDPVMTPEDRSGTAYLKARKQRLEASDAVKTEAELIVGWLGGIARRSSVELPGSGREPLLSLSFLVPRGALGRFLESVKTLEPLVPGKLLLTGPWPPYHFTTKPDKSSLLNDNEICFESTKAS